MVRQGHWEYAERTKTSRAVAIVAVTADRKILLTEQFRIPLGKRVIELPAGLVGDCTSNASEEYVAAARRELLEETGYEAAGMRLMTVGPPTAGLASEMVAFTLATGLKQVAAGGGDEAEDIEVHKVALSDVRRWLEEQIPRDVLIDPKIFAGLYFAEHPS
ncbi:MAG TPA: NUDIX hydrolase [Pirellulales bacterium]|nr:NUDIX hydrolase [Pirellulales bacterium]